MVTALWVRDVVKERSRKMLSISYLCFQRSIPVMSDWMLEDLRKFESETSPPPPPPLTTVGSFSSSLSPSLDCGLLRLSTTSSPWASKWNGDRMNTIHIRMIRISRTIILDGSNLNIISVYSPYMFLARTWGHRRELSNFSSTSQWWFCWRLHDRETSLPLIPFRNLSQFLWNALALFYSGNDSNAEKKPFRGKFE